MKIDLETLLACSIHDLRQFANRFQIKGKNKKQLAQNIYDKYVKLEKYDKYEFLYQLGYEGKDGRTFLAKNKNKQLVAIKFFKPNKSCKHIEKEAKLQTIASNHNISPSVYEVNLEDKFIVMDLCDKTLYDVLKEQNGKLTLKQQQHIISLFQQLDECKVFHNDPNTLNFMLKNGDWKMIDFGFSIPINSYCINKYGSNPNMKYMPFGLLLKLKKLYPDQKYIIFEKYTLS